MSEVRDDDVTMSDAHTHVGQCAQPHFNIVRMEEQLTPPGSMFRLAQEEQGDNLALLAHHRLADGQIYGELASEEATAAMASKDPNFVVRLGALYETTGSARAGCNAIMVEAIANRNIDISALPTVHIRPQQPRVWPVHVYHGPHTDLMYVSHVLLFLTGKSQLHFAELRPGKDARYGEDRTWNTDASMAGEDFD